MPIWLLVGSSVILTAILLFAIAKIKGTPFRTIASLFLFGMTLAAPFIAVEYFSFNLKFYFVILSFIAIEIAILFFEKHVKCFHALLHHNVKDLRFLSFVLMGMGFTYSELLAYLLHAAVNTQEFLTTLPVKALFGIFIHTILTSASSVLHAGAMLVESVFEVILRFLAYYTRLAIIGASHYLYLFFTTHNLSLYVIPFLILNIAFFFWFKDYLDRKKGVLA